MVAVALSAPVLSVRFPGEEWFDAGRLCHGTASPKHLLTPTLVTVYSKARIRLAWARCLPLVPATTMEKGRATVADWFTIADAVSLLDAPRTEPPSLIDTSRPPFSSWALLLLPAALIVSAAIYVLRSLPALSLLAAW